MKKILLILFMGISILGYTQTTSTTDSTSKLVEDSLEVKVDRALAQSIKELSTCSEEYQKWFIGNFTFKRGQMDFMTKPIPPTPPKH